MRREFNRAEALQNNKRAGTVGFALTILQRRLASSPEAIYQSLRRRKERLEARLQDLKQKKATGILQPSFPVLDTEEIDDLEDAPERELETIEEQILDQATAARTIEELEAEINSLRRLEKLALQVRRSGEDRKWRELSDVLTEIFIPATSASHAAESAPSYGAEPTPRPKPSPEQKLVIFTEHRDTLNYLTERITTLLGRSDSLVTIHGGMSRRERRQGSGGLLARS